ncbi:hypothetical protein [Terriglobus saanensis]|uniref:Uncharacterized protein n=1 Tax=Terriglobus saanensis (strain ATCC BAA-1853 / DSM 23119 / SP1PR4) TaxID=401053 RepID=E8UXV5_TERSS|nr:hypothetical protein [Terriglobus saanensis]ADV83121.1 hypothetical protein AciPR4_2333 [Terriglobus saanensis SP1PR4]
MRYCSLFREDPSAAGKLLTLLHFVAANRIPLIVAVSLSTVCLLVHFLALEHSWLQVARYDLPTIFLYARFSWWIHSFIKSRRHLEHMLKHHGEELKVAVKASTSELFHEIQVKRKRL